LAFFILHKYIHWVCDQKYIESSRVFIIVTFQIEKVTYLSGASFLPCCNPIFVSRYFHCQLKNFTCVLYFSFVRNLHVYFVYFLVLFCFTSVALTVHCTWTNQILYLFLRSGSNTYSLLSFYKGLIPFWVPVMLANLCFNLCKNENLDYAFVILDSSVYCPSFNHVSRIYIHDTWNEGPKVEETETTETKSGGIWSYRDTIYTDSADVVKWWTKNKGIWNYKDKIIFFCRD